MTNPDDNALVAQMRAATEATWFKAEPHDGGVLIRGEDPLDYVWQTIAQARDIISKLENAIRQQEANNAGR